MLRLGEIVARLGGCLQGDPEIAILRLAPLERAGAGELAFLSNPKYKAQLTTTRAAAVIMAPDVAETTVAAILTPQPYLYFARVAQWLNPLPTAVPGIHPSAVVEGEVAASAQIGPGCVIGAGARIADAVVLGANCSVGADVQIGEGSRLAANVTIYDGCRLGARAIVHAGAVIGADGFGFAQDEAAAWVKIPQTGRVIIGDDVEIGAGTTIDRGAMNDTIIGNGVKLDNQIQVGHNVVIGEHTAMAGCVGIAGSAVIGAYCTVGGGAVILGHLRVADRVHITAGTLVAKSIPAAGTYSATVPFLEHGQWRRNFAHLRHLDTMADRIRALELRLAALENPS